MMLPPGNPERAATAEVSGRTWGASIEDSISGRSISPPTWASFSATRRPRNGRTCCPRSGRPTTTMPGTTSGRRSPVTPGKRGMAGTTATSGSRFCWRQARTAADETSFLSALGEIQQIVTSRPRGDLLCSAPMAHCAATRYRRLHARPGRWRSYRLLRPASARAAVPPVVRWGQSGAKTDGSRGTWTRR